MISSAILVQANRWQRSFQPSMKARMTVANWPTLSKDPRRIAGRVMIPKNTSTMFSQEPEVGVKCSVIRGLRDSHALISAFLPPSPNRSSRR
jgi:hypothetical protein